MPLLKRVSEGAGGPTIELSGPLFVIGRAPECHLILNNQGVSRKHAEIRAEGSAYVLHDLNSRNKTRINDEDLEPDAGHPLRNGDRINICDVEFVYYTKLPKGPDDSSSQVMTLLDDDAAALTSLDASRVDSQSSIRPEAKLRAILEIGRNIGTDLDVDTMAPKVLDTLFNLFSQSERAFLVLQEPETKRLIRKAFKHRQTRAGLRGMSIGAYADEAPMTLSRSIVNHVIDQKKAVISQDAGNDRNLPTSASIADLKIRSVMCAPLLTPDGKALGILQLDTSDRKQFTQEDLDLLVSVANQAAIAIQNATLHGELLNKDRLDRDLSLANRIQKGFLPRQTPKIPGYQFFAHYLPTYQVGGDFYDFVGLPGDRLAVALGDVAGKGISAALMMAKFSGDTRYCILTEDAPAPAVDALNSLLCDAGIEEKFITLSLSLLEPAERRLTVCSAGHPPILVRRAGGRVELVGEDSSGFPLGIMPDSTYQQVQVTLEPGDVVVVYSDGVTDPRSPSNEIYVTIKDNRLLRRIAESPGGPEDVGKAILQDIREFSAGAAQVDDITLVCFGPV